MKKYKWYLIYFYHDAFYNEFEEYKECNDYLNDLKERYKYDSDFHYKVIFGEELEM